MLEHKIKDTTIRLQIGDLTDMDINAIVFYASPDLKLGSGFGSAIAARGGSSIQEELIPYGTISVGKAVLTKGGQLKTNYIIHAVGPQFQEKDTEQKLSETMQSALRLANEKGINRIAFPPMGAGFYGVPLDICANIMLQAIKTHCSNGSSIEEIVVCVLDNREYKSFQNEWQNII